MPKGNLTVVISAGQSRNPQKRELEEAVAALTEKISGVNVLRVPHLYDLAKDGQTYAALHSLSGDLVVLAWLYDRAAHWILDRNGVRGQVGEVQLRHETDEEEEEQAAQEVTEDERVIDSQPRPDRLIYCIDFRVSNTPEDYQAEVQRILDSSTEDDGDLLQADELNRSLLTLEQLERFENPTNDTFVGSQTTGDSSGLSTLFGTSSVVSIDEHPSRRWYPVIDFSRCTNCMECIDFCLFGVYGVDSLETIVVEQADNCRKGCPACSRVCPQNAIIFPQHKTPAIAGAPVDSGGLKIDLSKLFGAPEENEDALEVAARERDEQLILAGREAVGNSTGIGERLAKSSREDAKPDDLDNLIDQLDSLDL